MINIVQKKAFPIFSNAFFIVDRQTVSIP